MFVPPLLQLSSVTKSFGVVRALKGVSFDLRASEVHALLGENGAGKSTLIKIITGAHQPDAGTIHINGELIGSLTPAIAHKLGITCIYQQPALFPDLTVAENIGLRLEGTSTLRKVNWSARRGRAKELLDRIGANISTDVEVCSLSMPEQQLVEIACALGTGARTVIMDEPTSALTQREVELLFAVIGELRSSGVGVIYISHRLKEIFALADRVTVLRDGESVGTREVQRERSLSPQRGEGRGEGWLGKTGKLCEQVGQNHPSPSIPLPVEGRGKADSGSSLSESELIRMMVGREVSQVYPQSDNAPGEIVLSVRQLGCAFSGVRDVTFDVRAGAIVGLSGLVGAGRTELARILFGITPADSGEIILNGRSVTILSPQEAVAYGIAYVPEDRRRHGLILDMPIAQNITMAIHHRLFPGTWLRLGKERQLAETFIRDLDVKTYGPGAPGNSLSGGNQQKVSLARWLATEPRLLILDEPTQGVDVGAKSEIHKIIRSLAKEGIAVLLISSDLPEVLGLSDRIAVIRGGTIVAMMPGKSAAHELMAAALGQTSAADATKL